MRLVDVIGPEMREHIFAIAVAAVFWFLPSLVTGMPRQIAWVGLGVALGMVGFTFLPIDQKYIGPILLFALAALFAVSGAIWGLQLYRSSGPVQENTKIPALFLECLAAVPPKTMPESGVIWTLQLQSDGSGGGSLAQMSGPPGGDMVAFFWEGYKCNVTNYSDKPVSKVEIAADLKTYEAIPTTNGFNSGPQSVHKNITILIPKIDSGKDNPFTFYIFNMSPQFMEINFLEKTKLTIIGDGNDVYEGALQQSYLGSIHLSPRYGMLPQK